MGHVPGRYMAVLSSAVPVPAQRAWSVWPTILELHQQGGVCGALWPKDRGRGGTYCWTSSSMTMQPARSAATWFSGVCVRLTHIIRTVYFKLY